MIGDHSRSSDDSSGPQLYDLDEAGRQLGGLSRTSLYKLFKEGQLRPVKVLDRTMLTDAELRRFIAALEHAI